MASHLALSSNSFGTTYPNTIDTARHLGWTYVRDYCFGDVDAAFVTHNSHKGTFTFHNKPEVGAQP